MGGGALAMLTHSIYSPAFYCAVLGAVFALWLYSDWPRRTAAFADNPLHDILLAKYGFDTFNDWFFAGGARRLGGVLWKHIDASLIDGFFVNGTARLIGASSAGYSALAKRRDIPLRFCHVVCGGVGVILAVMAHQIKPLLGAARKITGGCGGDNWRIICGDSLKILPRLPEKSANLIFADPPYNLQLKNKLYRPNMTKVSGVDDDWDKFESFDVYDEFCRAWLLECRRLLAR